MRQCRGWAMAIVAVCLLGECRAAAQGGPPYYTNDPITPGPSRWEINVGYIPLLATDQSTRRMPDLDINYGVGERIQLTLELGWLGVQTVTEPEKFGLAQDIVGVKWRFVDDNRGFALSMFPQGAFNNPDDSVERGIAPPGASLTLPIEVTKQVGYFAVNGEVGYTFVHLGRNTWLAGVVAGHEKRIGRKRYAQFEFDGEFYATGEVGGDVTQATLGAGVRWQPHAPFTVLAMAGRSVRQPAGSFAGYLGVQLRLPASEPER